MLDSPQVVFLCAKRLTDKCKSQDEKVIEVSVVTLKSQKKGFYRAVPQGYYSNAYSSDLRLSSSGYELAGLVGREGLGGIGGLEGVVCVIYKKTKNWALQKYKNTITVP